MSSKLSVLGVLLLGSNIFIVQSLVARYHDTTQTAADGMQIEKSNGDILYEPSKSGMRAFQIPPVRDNTPQAKVLKDQMIQSRKSGESLWGSPGWMKPASAYHEMDTYSLVDDCFARPIFGFEIMIFDDELAGLLRLQVYHDGFQELFNRNDMWKGIIHYLDRVTKELTPDINFQTLVMHTTNLNGIPYLYQVDSFAKQMSGHEQDYLAAHLRLIHAFINFIDRYDSSKTGGSYGFYREPLAIASQAVALYRILKPDGYSDPVPALMRIEVRGNQDISKVRKFLDCTVQRIEERGIPLVH